MTDAAVGEEAKGGKTYRVGNLVYTKKGLILLFFWLLWFDFCFSIMETVLGPIIQFRLKNDLKADALLFTMFVVTIPSIINFFLNPIISIKSDRHRGPRGRRIPFLLYGAPVVCACLALLGFGNEIAAWAHGSFFSSFSQDNVTIWTFGILYLVFNVFNMFLGTTFYYLFNDVVPEEHFVKFMAYMRVVGGFAGMVYSWYIFGYSNKWGPLHIDLGFFHYHTDNIWYPKLILVGAAVFYTIAGTIAMLKVKEPSYPPPPPLAEGEGFVEKTRTTIKTIAKECFSHKFYVIFFITMMMNWMTYQMGQFMNPMRVDLGMDLAVLGKIGTATTFIGMILTLATANWGDRFRPLPLMVFSMVLMVLTSPISLLFLIPGLSPNTYLWIQIACSLVNLPIGVVYGMAESPLGMSLLPRERYGQFSAAQSMMRMILPGILGSMLAGWLMRTLEHHQGSYALRYSFVWNFVFQALTLACYYWLYKEWKRLGGKHGFKPPPVGPVPGGPVTTAVPAAPA